MENVKPGDIVTRKSYGSDIFFKVVGFKDLEVDHKVVKVAILKGLDVRLYADAQLSDLQRVSYKQIEKFRRDFISRNNECLARIYAHKEQVMSQLHRGINSPGEGNHQFFEISGKVLHVDGNPDYLHLCEEIYSQLGIEARGVNVREKEQPDRVHDLIVNFQPDVLVLTGHDGFIKGKHDIKDLNSYRNSKYFVRAVEIARRYRPNKDDLVIVAGACQSHYESILRAGANFASSPRRVFIHAFDPVYIVEKICFTSCAKTVSVDEAIENTITGISGLGGIETRGKHRWGYPRSPY